MHETEQDIRELQELLDRSHASAGEHMRSIFTDERRVGAQRVCELLTGVQVLNLATVTAACEPRVAPVDGLFYRGRFWFGSSHTSIRFKHIRRRPQVSASHTRGEELAVIIHGRAHEVDVKGHLEFRKYVAEVYGGDWENWAGDAPYARIDPARMYTFGGV